jgi:hypothetical protein
LNKKIEIEIVSISKFQKKLKIENFHFMGSHPLVERPTPPLRMVVTPIFPLH